MIQEIHNLVSDVKNILIIQADNPDGDSLGSALALETILSSMDKNPYLYCGVDMPGYLRYMPGWDRVSSEIPQDFDLSIIVDASTMTLFEKMIDSGMQTRVSSKPCIVLDHHKTVENEVPFATILLNDDTVSSTGELIYRIAKQNNWPLDKNSARFIMSAVLGDTQGLTNSLTTSETYRLMADITDLGVERALLEEQRREYSKMPPEIYSYKARLIDRTEFYADGRLAMVVIPHDEIIAYSPLYNPGPLIQTDMLQTKGVGMAIVLKSYNDGKILGAVRCNPGFDIASSLAEHFGGGGHVYASGFKLLNNRDFDHIKQDIINKSAEFIGDIIKDNSSEDIQHAYSTD